MNVARVSAPIDFGGVGGESARTPIRWNPQMKGIAMKLRLLLGLALLMTLNTACKEKSNSPAPGANDVTASDVKEKVKAAADTTSAYLKKQRDQFADKMDKELDKLSDEIDDLQRKADEASENAKAELHDQIEKLKEKREAAREKLAKLRDKSADAWEEMKDGMQSAVDDLKDAYKDAKSKLDEDSGT